MSAGDVRFTVMHPMHMLSDVSGESVAFSSLPAKFDSIMAHEDGVVKPVPEIVAAVQLLAQDLISDAVTEGARPNVRENVHHLDVWVTSDPLTVIEVGDRHPCEVCASMTRKVLASLEAAECRWMVCVVIFWATVALPGSSMN